MAARAAATFCIVTVFNNVIARLRRTGTNLEDASADLGAGIGVTTIGHTDDEVVAAGSGVGRRVLAENETAPPGSEREAYSLVTRSSTSAGWPRCPPPPGGRARRPSSRR